MSRRYCLGWVTVAVLVMGLALPARALDAEPLQAIRVKDRGHLADPQAAFWKQAPAVTVTMLPQMIAFPMQPTVSVTSLSVKAVHNEQWLAILLEWKDLTKNDRIVLDRFGDQAAVELPIYFSKDAMPSPMMGNPGGGLPSGNGGQRSNMIPIRASQPCGTFTLMPWWISIPTRY